MHDSLMSAGTNGHANLLGRLSVALNSFWNALNFIGRQNDVTTFTMSTASNGPPSFASTPGSAPSPWWKAKWTPRRGPSVRSCAS